MSTNRVIILTIGIIKELAKTNIKKSMDIVCYYSEKNTSRGSCVLWYGFCNISGLIGFIPKGCIAICDCVETLLTKFRCARIDILLREVKDD